MEIEIEDGDLNRKGKEKEVEPSRQDLDESHHGRCPILEHLLPCSWNIDGDPECR